MFQRNKKTVEETMDIMSVKEASERWNISERWIQKLCEEGRIEGVQRFGRFWMIPKEAQKPADLRLSLIHI